MKNEKLAGKAGITRTSSKTRCCPKTHPQHLKKRRKVSIILRTKSASFCNTPGIENKKQGHTHHPSYFTQQESTCHHTSHISIRHAPHHNTCASHLTPYIRHNTTSYTLPGITYWCLVPGIIRTPSHIIRHSPFISDIIIHHLFHLMRVHLPLVDGN